MLKGVKVRKVYEDEIEEPVRQKKVRIMDDQLHKQRIKEKGLQFDDLEDDDQKPDNQKTKQEKNKENQKKGEMLFQQRQLQKAISECEFCLSNEQLSQYYILSQSTNAMLVLPKSRFYNAYTHLLIVPMEHVQCIRDVEDETYEEIRNFQKCLVGAFDKVNMECIFYENAFKFKYVPHAIIECVAIPYKISKEANLNLYFKQGMDELDGFWSTHKKIIEIQKNKGGIRKQIPKGFAYFYVDFSLKLGYAHVIENENNFSSNFAREILASILSVEKSNVLSPKPRTEIEAKQENDAFQLIWKQYDWTVLRQ
ncbi:unnamed protein product [Paramecium pentaurelia]|uniref:Uncharacterized protein n=1 Tax=Paramecium pentaurelia TaxID=43138 RepID=A0A8S1Y5C6_9CILI|nr:unnamed protein product [Paramecium pentaurelia]